MTGDTIVRSGIGNSFAQVDSLQEGDRVNVLGQLRNWYIIRMDNNQVGAIERDNTTPIVRDDEEEPLDPNPEPEPEIDNGIEEREDVEEVQPVRDLTVEEDQMINLVNRARQDNNLEPLTTDPELTRVARIKSQDMVDNDYFSHNSPTFGSPFDMLDHFGIKYLYAGENLAANPSIENAHTSLMNSPGHRQNILNENFTHIGIGIKPQDRYGFIITQLFIGKPQ